MLRKASLLISVFLAATLVLLGPVWMLSIVHAGPVEQVNVAEASVWAVQNAFPALPSDVFQGPLPLTVDDTANSEMKLEITTPNEGLLVEHLPAQLRVGIREKGCPPCFRLKRDIIDVLTAYLWSIGYADTDQIQFYILPDTESAPQVDLYQDGVLQQHWQGYTSPAILSNALRKSWDAVVDRPSYGAATKVQTAGVIQAKSQIASAISQWRQRIGEKVPCKLEWSRSGSQSISLLAQGEWTAEAILGKSGHVGLSATGALNLPIDSLGFGYRVDGDDIVPDLDSVRIKGLAKFLSAGRDSRPLASASPSEFFLIDDAIISWSVVSAIKGLTSLLWPHLDLDLPGDISATAVLNGDMIAVDFAKGPTIRLVALFTFKLGVSRVEITADKVRVLFIGSRLVKERTFTVK